MTHKRWMQCLTIVGVCCFSTPLWAQSSSSNPFGSKDDVLRYIKTPKGCNITIERGRNIHYTAPAKNFEEPIRIQFQEKNGVKRPDILVWADEIHWHADVKSGTASGRIVVDDQREYRVETTYVEYNHLTQQIYCPRRTKIIQKNPDGYTSKMTAESALLDFDESGIRTAKFDRVIEMDMVIPQDGTSPFKTDKPKSNSKSKEKSQSASKSKETAEKVISMEDRKIKKMEGIAE
ncbi:MAG: hypothetical protein AMXMBFR75_09360 [Candidatus Hinthialibacteria bacterium]